MVRKCHSMHIYARIANQNQNNHGVNNKYISDAVHTVGDDY